MTESHALHGDSPQETEPSFRRHNPLVNIAKLAEVPPQLQFARAAAAASRNRRLNNRQAVFDSHRAVEYNRSLSPRTLILLPRRTISTSQLADNIRRESAFLHPFLALSRVEQPADS